YTARTWELSRRKSVSPHDGLGSNLVVQVKQSRVMRVLPLDNDAINECWLSDKDRFSYEGLNAPGRLKQPMMKRDTRWEPVDWEVALEFAVAGLQKQDFGVLASPHSTLEELYLGGYLAGLPAGGNVNSILARKALVLLGCEPELDFADPRSATRAVNEAEFVVQLNAFETGLEYADVLLPIAPFTETAGTFVNTEG